MAFEVVRELYVKDGDAKGIGEVVFSCVRHLLVLLLLYADVEHAVQMVLGLNIHCGELSYWLSNASRPDFVFAD